MRVETTCTALAQVPDTVQKRCAQGPHPQRRKVRIGSRPVSLREPRHRERWSVKTRHWVAAACPDCLPCQGASSSPSPRSTTWRRRCCRWLRACVFIVALPAWRPLSIFSTKPPPGQASWPFRALQDVHGGGLPVLPGWAQACSSLCPAEEQNEG